MKLKSIFFIPILFVLLFISCDKESDVLKEANLIMDSEISNNLYFPPLNSDEWQSETITNLGWNQNSLEPLLNFLDEKNTKSFMILYNGKIVVEHYFNNHSANSLWYWASAGKTLTSTISGIAQNEGYIDINHKVSDYLGTNWTSLPLEKENLILCKNLLSMNSGLDDTLGDDVSPSNLKYIANAGERWAYHNVYVKMQDVVEKATNLSWNNYFKTKLRDKIGMTGAWRNIGSLNVYWSNTRSMARFGLLIYANGSWNDSIIIPENFIKEATNTSQNINKSYGYLWWLNGKSSYYLPQSQFEFKGALIPKAPSDMFCALGKNDQKIYVVPSKKLVVIRMGESAESSNFALSSFDNDLWEKIGNLIN